MAAAAAAGAALGGSRMNPIASGPSLRPMGKLAPLADITNTGRPNPPRSVSVADLLKENAKLVHLLGEKTNIIEISSVEMHKLRFALHATRQQNLMLAKANTQILGELNQGKDRLKTLQHELGCATAFLKLKTSKVERNNKGSKQLQKEVTLQEIKAPPSKQAVIEAYEAHNEGTNASVHRLAEPQSVVPSNTVHQAPPPDKTNKRTSMSRRTSKQMSESCEATTDSKTEQHIGKRHEDPRNTLRRRSSRLNPGSCEITDVSCETLHKATVVPSASSLSVLKHHDPNSGEDTSMSNQDGLVHNIVAPACKIKASELKKNGIKKQPQKKENAKEIPATHSRTAGVEVPEAHTNDYKATGTHRNKFAKTQSSLSFDIQHPEPLQERANNRDANKRKLESCEGRKDSTSSEALHHEETRKSLRRKSARLNPRSCEVISGTLETALEDDIAHVEPSRHESVQDDDVAASAPSDPNLLIDQSKKNRQSDSGSSMEPSGQQAAGRSSLQVTGRRSSVRAAAKEISYKEIPLNMKMRRP